MGNELWGCGGNLTGGEYATQFRNFATFLPKLGNAPQPFLIACGPSKDNTEWTQDFLTGMPDGYAMHYYSNSKAPATKFTLEEMAAQFAALPQMESAIIHQRSLIDPFDPQKKIGLMVDEWVFGTAWCRKKKNRTDVCGNKSVCVPAWRPRWANVFHRQADKLVMCNIAQMVNVLDSMLLTSEEKCVRTPSYYAFELAKSLRGKTAIKTDAPAETGLDLSVSAGVQDGSLVVMLVNPKHDETINLTCSIKGHTASSAKGRALFHADMNAWQYVRSSQYACST